MKKINDLLRKLNIKPQKYQKEGKVYIVCDGEHKYVVKKNDHPIYEYLNQRNFDYYPNTVVKDGYEIASFEEEIKRPDEEKILDLVSLVSLLHAKTTYYKSVNEYDFQDIYETLLSEIADVKNYYDNLMDTIESEIFMSPSSYFLARHITQIYNAISYCEYHLKKWYEENKNNTKMRQSIIHNNLSLNHYINNKLISWNQAKFSSPVFDIYHLYKETYCDFVWEEIMKSYHNKYPLKNNELELFYILISIPNKIELNDDEYHNTIVVNRQLEYIDKTGTFIECMQKAS